MSTGMPGYSTDINDQSLCRLAGCPLKAVQRLPKFFIYLRSNLIYCLVPDN